MKALPRVFAWLAFAAVCFAAYTAWGVWHSPWKAYTVTPVPLSSPVLNELPPMPQGCKDKDCAK
jgi:hypothetical protein